MQLLLKTSEGPFKRLVSTEDQSSKCHFYWDDSPLFYRCHTEEHSGKQRTALSFQ